MFAAFSLVLLGLLSLIVTRIATVALTLTGLSRETARFQARSALSGAGFTTLESEAVVNHPVRRRIVMNLIFLGSIGLVSIIATLSATFVNSKDLRDFTGRGLMLTGGLAVIYALASSRWFDRALTPLMRRMLQRFTDLDVRDYASLLQIAGDYAVMELLVEDGDWLADKTLAALRLPDEGVLVLGIQRPQQDYLGAPEGDTTVHATDTLVLYGRRQRLAELDQRDARSGQARHRNATEEEELSRAAQAEHDDDPTDMTIEDPPA